jgi:acetate kinase
MKVLVINCGSSSLKYRLYQIEPELILASGLAERVGEFSSILHYVPQGGEKVSQSIFIPDHEFAFRQVMNLLTHPNLGVISSGEEINAVGHRVVHGGEKFSRPVKITDEVKKIIRECFSLAPLHNPPNLMGIEVAEKVLPGVPQVACFDTAFHQTLPSYAYLYGIPYELYQKYGIRRYGFHGTSHKYVALRTASLLKKPLEETKIIVCHLGNGSSITAVNGGKSVDTSMGFTPLEGVLMGTRCGDIDPYIILFLQGKEGLSLEDMNDFLNKKCGLWGLSGLSNDMRDVEEAAFSGHERARLALEVYAYRVRKYIGAYAAAMGGVDAIAFTAGIGENQILTRQMICQGLEFLGVRLDLHANQVKRVEKIISTDDSRVKVMIVPTDEELMIARETASLLGLFSAPSSSSS